MRWLLIKSLLRDWRRNPWQILFSILGVALGVAVVAGIDLANETALEEFHQSNRLLDGMATHRIMGPGTTLDQEWFRVIKVEQGVYRAAPVISIRFSIPGHPADFTLLGVDPFSDFRLRQLALRQTTTSQPSLNPVYLPVQLQQTLDVVPGSTINVMIGNSARQLSVVGTLESGTADVGQLNRLVVADIAVAQKLANMGGQISYIDLAVDSHDFDRLVSQLPENLRFISLHVSNHAREQMTVAFRTNLDALALLALVIGMFLVFSTMRFQVIRRRELFGLLRSTGITSVQLFAIIGFEALILGVAGTLSGMLMGSILSQFLNALVTETINNLYYTLNTSVTQWTALTLVKVFLTGVLITLVAAATPAWQAARSPVRELLSDSSQVGVRHWKTLVVIIVAGLLAGWILTRMGDSLTLAFAGLFLIIVSVAICTPLWITGWAKVVANSQLFNLLPLFCLALRNAAAHLSRTSVATAALAVAVSATLGIGLMIDSFRHSVEVWLVNYLRADIYLRQVDVGVSDHFMEKLLDIPGVAAVSRGRRDKLETAEGPVELFILDTNPRGFSGFQVKQGDPESLWQKFTSEQQILISEPLAARRNIGLGDVIELPTLTGKRAFEIAAVYYDYSSDQGLVTMSANTHRQWFEPQPWLAAALYLEAWADQQTVLDVVNELVTDQAMVRSNQALRNSTMKIFDRTFVVTDVLRWLAVIIAMAGILSAMWSIQIERGREFALLRGQGMTPAQLAGLIMGEAAWLGGLAGLLAIPMGLLLSLFLIDVINIRSFGWSMQTRVDFVLIVEALGLAVFAALAGGLYPALKGMHTPVAKRLQQDV